MLSTFCRASAANAGWRDRVRKAEIRKLRERERLERGSASSACSLSRYRVPRLIDRVLPVSSTLLRSFSLASNE